MKKLFHFLVVGLAATTLVTSCGWQLRGAPKNFPPGSQLYIQSENPRSDIAEVLTRLLQNGGVEGPRWFLEGMAELMATFDIRRDNCVVGRTSGELLSFIQQFRYLMPWEDFFAVAANSAEYERAGNRDLFSGQLLVTQVLMRTCRCGLLGDFLRARAGRVTRLVNVTENRKRRRPCGGHNRQHPG